MAGVLLLAPATALPGSVKGKVTGAQRLLNPVWSEAKDASANRFTWREPSPTVKAEFRTLFAHAPKEVCIAAIGANNAPPSTGAIAFKITGGRTSPVTLVVPPGASIEFQNRDPFPHKPYLVGQGSFQAAEMKSGAVRQWKAPAPGKYELRDELAPSVRSWIVVDPKVAGIAYPGRDGSFTFGNLPEGEYTLRAYFNGEPSGKPLQVNVRATGNLDLREALVIADEPKEKGK
ncbi:MAG: hypothetical protein IT374_19970 [Polyangiaceae bacterium]|nr:hypothetical protein [Polyangiaceae bacterium]